MIDIFVSSIYPIVPVYMAEYIKSEKNISKLLAEKTHSLRELACINELSEIIRLGKTIDETLQKTLFELYCTKTFLLWKDYS